MLSNQLYTADQQERALPTRHTSTPGHETAAARQRCCISGAAGAADGTSTADNDAAAAAAGQVEWSPGCFCPLDGAPRKVGATGPDWKLVAVARRYARENGILLERQAEYVEIDTDRAVRIAQAYDAMRDEPGNPVVREAYESFVAQLLAQYHALTEAGYTFWLMDPENDPNKGNPWNAMRTLRETQSLAVYPTTSAFGPCPPSDACTHPLVRGSGIHWPSGAPDGPSREVTLNDIFRAVHDCFGHCQEGAGFRARGEENAWQAHVRLFTGPAVAALTSETRGQNSWLNYGPHGEANRTASVTETIFATPKTGLLPEWTWTEGRAAKMPAGQAAHCRCGAKPRAPSA